MICAIQDLKRIIPDAVESAGDVKLPGAGQVVIIAVLIIVVFIIFVVIIFVVIIFVVIIFVVIIVIIIFFIYTIIIVSSFSSFS